jgi:hypothetical protein
MSRRSLPSPALCVAILALFISLGGTTYAITSLPRDSVGTEQIRSRAVTEDELSNSAVITRKLANGAVTQRKLARGAITGSRVAPDSLGGPQIDESSLLAVPFAQDAARADVALRAQVADRVERVARAETAGTADRATLADKAAQAEHADQADQADRSSVADALAVVDTNFEPADVPEGESEDFFVECDVAPGLVAINGGWIAFDDIDDLPAVTGSVPFGDTWVVSVTDLDTDDPPVDTPGAAFAICVKAKDAT